jgi:addiction module HigA family antidote
MPPENNLPSHPGEILQEEFLNPLGLSQVAFAAHIGVSIQRVNEVVRGKRGITPDTAWLLADALGTTPEFWMNLQVNYDLARYHPKRHVARIATVAAQADSKD